MVSLFPESEVRSRASLRYSALEGLELSKRCNLGVGLTVASVSNASIPQQLLNSPLVTGLRRCQKPVTQIQSCGPESRGFLNKVVMLASHT